MKWKVLSCTRQHSRTGQVRHLCTGCHTAAFPTLEPRGLISEHPFPELHSHMGSSLFPTIFLHQKVRIWKFFPFLFSHARSNLWNGWILGAGATHDSHIRFRAGHAHRERHGYATGSRGRWGAQKRRVGPLEPPGAPAGERALTG